MHPLLFIYHSIYLTSKVLIDAYSVLISYSPINGLFPDLAGKFSQLAEIL
jgi:hypothetical protein